MDTPPSWTRVPLAGLDVDRLRAVGIEQEDEIGRMGLPIRSGLVLRSNPPIDSRRSERTLANFDLGGRARRNLRYEPEALVSSQLEVSDQSLDKHIGLLVLQGELDRTTSPSLAATLKSACASNGFGVIIDLTELTSLDASGIGLLRESQLRSAGVGGWLAFVSDERCDAWLLAAPRWGATPDVFHSRAEAIAAVKRRNLLVRPTAVRTLLDVPAG